VLPVGVLWLAAALVSLTGFLRARRRADRDPPRAL